MFQALKTTVCQIAIFMICAQAITHFRPKESYEKYLKLLLGLMILIQIFQPFCKLFFGVTGQELSASVEHFQQQINESMAEAAEQSARAGAQLETMSLLEVQERLAQEAWGSQSGDASDGQSGDAAPANVSDGQSKEAAQPPSAADSQSGEVQPPNAADSQSKEAAQSPNASDSQSGEIQPVEPIQIEVKLSDE